MSRYARKLPVLLLSTASAAFAQLPMIAFSGGFGGGPSGFQGNATFSRMGAIQLKAGAPFSGEPKTEHVQTLADGTHITRTIPTRGEKFWRDSQGRMRIEQAMCGSAPSSLQNHCPTLVEIQDPAAGYVYIMDDVNKVAHRLKEQVVPARSMEPRMVTQTAAPRASAVGGGGGGGGQAGAVAGITGLPADLPDLPRMRPQISSEDLGMQTIDGVSVHGIRQTDVIPTGSVGNDGPITTTRDSWYSSDLNLVIQTVTNDPRSGRQTQGIANLNRAEPDPTLFMVPPDYTIVDETGDFTIRWGSAQNQ